MAEELTKGFGGMHRDTVRRYYPDGKYLDAENINQTPPEVNSRFGATAAKGSEFAFEFGAINFGADSDDYIALRFELDLTTTGIVHTFQYDDGSLQPPFNISSAQVTAALRYADLVSQLETATASIGGEVYINAPVTNVAQKVHIGFRAYGYSYVFTETVGGTSFSINVLKPFYGTASNGYFEPLYGFKLPIGNDLFILSSNGPVFRFGVAQEALDGTWTYTVLLQTNAFTYNEADTFGDMPGEIAFGDRVSLYPTAWGYVPRTLYVKLQETWVANSAMVWNENPAYIETGNPDGFYSYETVAEQTQTQIIENKARVTNAVPNNSGGSLSTGGYEYIIRQKVSTASVSGFGIRSGMIPVFRDGLGDTQLSGDTGGRFTSKSTTLTIQGLNPRIYTKLELVVIVNTDGVISSYGIEYDITGETMEVIHTGNETRFEITIAEINAQQVIFETVGSARIVRNKLTYGRIQIAADINLAAAAQTITITSRRRAIPSVGNDFSSVNEYMVPRNTFLYAGYMHRETYRIGIFFYLKGGRVTPVYFVKDHKLDDIGLLLCDTSLGEIYAYYLEADVDFSTFPDIDGVPFTEAVEGWSYVRRPCIPEIHPGYYLPQTDLPLPYYSVGGHVPYFGAYAGFSNDMRRQGAWISLGNLFGTTQIDSFFAGDTFYNHGQTNVYNTDIENIPDGSNITHYTLTEYGGDFDPTGVSIQPNLSYQSVGFNSNGTRVINTNILSTQVNTYFKCNQALVATGTSNGDPVPNKLTSYLDRGFYYFPLYRPASSLSQSKYGPTTSGTYISTGHFRAMESGTTVYQDDIFGGDTFTQKNVIKWQNQAVPTITANLDATVGTPVADGLRQYVMVANFAGPLASVTQAYSITLPDQGGGLYGGSVFLNWSPIPGALSYDIYRINPGSIVFRIASGLSATNMLDNGIAGALDVIPTPTLSNVMRAGISFYSQNRGNYQLRSFPDNNTDNYPYTTGSLVSWLADPQNPGTYNYSASYTPPDEAPVLYPSYDADAQVDLSQPNAMYYSEQGVEGALIDSKRIFRPLNFKLFPAIYGTIRNIFLIATNYLMVLMDRAILSQTVDQQQVQNNVDGSAITIGDGTVLGAREVTISNIGAPIKTGAIQYIGYTGQQYMAWYEPRLKKLMQYRGGTINDVENDIGEKTGNQSFIAKNNDLVMAERSIIFGSDFLRKEVMITAVNSISGSVVYDLGDTYAAGNIVYTVNSVMQRQYYRAKISVPINKNPDTIANQLQYWEKYRQSNYTLIFNQKLNEITGLWNFYPKMYLDFNDTFLTHALKEASPIDSYVYEHNKGLDMYDDIDFTSSVTVLFKDNPENYKTGRILMVDIQDQPVYLFVRAVNIERDGTVKELKTYGDQANYSFVRPEWKIDIRNDATISAANPTGINTLMTAQPTGQFIEATIFFKNSSEISLNTLNSVLLKYVIKGPYKQQK